MFAMPGAVWPYASLLCCGCFVDSGGDVHCLAALQIGCQSKETACIWLVGGVTRCCLRCCGCDGGSSGFVPHAATTIHMARARCQKQCIIGWLMVCKVGRVCGRLACCNVTQSFGP
jgi:hypothetical protein